MQRPDRTTIRDASVLFAVSLAVRGIARLLTGFDGLYGQDAFAYYGYALQLRTALAGLHPPPPFFWPVGYPALVAAAMAVLGPLPLAGQLVSTVAGATLAPLTYALVREVRRDARVGALGAGALMAVASQLLISSLSVMSDASALAWLTLSAAALLRYTTRLERRWLALSAFAFGWAVLTRWACALAVAPWALAAGVAWRAARLPVRRVVGATALAVALGALVVGAQFGGDVGRPELSHLGEFKAVGWNASNAFRSTAPSSDGLHRYRVPIGIYYALPVLHPAFVFPLLSPLLLLGTASLRTVPGSRTVLLLGWPLAVYGLLAGMALENPRFSLALYPPLVALAGLGLQSALELRGGQRWKAAVWVVFGLGVLGALAWSARDLRRFVSVKNTAVDVSLWAQRNVPPGAIMLTFGLTSTVQHYTRLEGVELYNETPATLRERACGRRTVYLLLDAANVAAQWSGLSPHANFIWLAEHAGLTDVGHNGVYTLWRVGDRCRPRDATGPERDSGP